MKYTELKPINGRKSFYGKAKVIKEDNISKLLSYKTIVAEYNHTTNKMTINGWDMDARARHINAFPCMGRVDTLSKKELKSYE